VPTATTYRDRAAAARDPDLDFLFGDDPPADDPPTAVSTAAPPDPLSLLGWWVVERDGIRLAKAAGLPKPWTQNVYLQTARWCNVYRMHDRVSQYVLTTWMRPICRRTYTQKISGNSYVFGLVVQEEAAFTTKLAHEQTKLEHHVVARRGPAFAPALYKIIGREN